MYPFILDHSLKPKAFLASLLNGTCLRFCPLWGKPMRNAKRFKCYLLDRHVPDIEIKEINIDQIIWVHASIIDPRASNFHLQERNPRKYYKTIPFLGLTMCTSIGGISRYLVFRKSESSLETLWNSSHLSQLSFHRRST